MLSDDPPSIPPPRTKELKHHLRLTSFVYLLMFVNVFILFIGPTSERINLNVFGVCAAIVSITSTILTQATFRIWNIDRVLARTHKWIKADIIKISTLSQSGKNSYVLSAKFIRPDQKLQKFYEPNMSEEKALLYSQGGTVWVLVAPGNYNIYRIVV